MAHLHRAFDSETSGTTCGDIMPDSMPERFLVSPSILSVLVHTQCLLLLMPQGRSQESDGHRHVSTTKHHTRQQSSSTYQTTAAAARANLQEGRCVL